MSTGSIGRRQLLRVAGAGALGMAAAGMGTGRAFADDDGVVKPQAIVTGTTQAFQANTGSLWVYNLVGADARLGMAPGTSPSTALSVSNYVVAFQANTNVLWITGGLWGTMNLAVPMKPGTSPSVTLFPPAPDTASTYMIALQGANGNLWMKQRNVAARDTGHPMAPGTSPSIAWSSTLGMKVAFQGANGNLWTLTNGAVLDTGFPMMAGTSPSVGTDGITAYQGPETALWVTMYGYPANTRLGMLAGTSPSVGTVGTGTVIAFQDNTTALHLRMLNGLSGGGSTGLGMRAGTSPNVTTAVDRFGGHTYWVSFQANTSAFWLRSPTGNTTDTGLGMMAGTSPG